MLTVFKRLRARLFDRGSKSTRSPRKQRQDPLLSRAARRRTPDCVARGADLTPAPGSAESRVAAMAAARDPRLIGNPA
jgi:hypothetical protein